MEYGKCTDCLWSLRRSTSQETTLYCQLSGEGFDIRKPYLECTEYSQREAMKERFKKISGVITSKAPKKAGKSGNPKKK